MLYIERIDDIEYLPCDVISAAIDDDNVEDIVYLPYDETGIAADDNNNDEIITYLIVTNNTKGDLTIPDVDMICDVIIWNNPIDYYGIMDKTSLNGHYIKKGNIMNLIKNEMYLYNLRLIFDDGG